MHPDNSHHLVDAAKRRRANTLDRAHRALRVETWAPARRAANTEGDSDA